MRHFLKLLVTMAERLISHYRLTAYHDIWECAVKTHSYVYIRPRRKGWICDACHPEWDLELKYDELKHDH